MSNPGDLYQQSGHNSLRFLPGFTRRLGFISQTQSKRDWGTGSEYQSRSSFLYYPLPIPPPQPQPIYVKCSHSVLVCACAHTHTGSYMCACSPSRLDWAHSSFGVSLADWASSKLHCFTCICFTWPPLRIQVLATLPGSLQVSQGNFILWASTPPPSFSYHFEKQPDEPDSPSWQWRMLWMHFAVLMDFCSVALAHPHALRVSLHLLSPSFCYCHHLGRLGGLVMPPKLAAEVLLLLSPSLAQFTHTKGTQGSSWDDYSYLGIDVWNKTNVLDPWLPSFRGVHSIISPTDQLLGKEYAEEQRGHRVVLENLFLD